MLAAHTQLYTHTQTCIGCWWCFASLSLNRTVAASRYFVHSLTHRCAYTLSMCLSGCCVRVCVCVCLFQLHTYISALHCGRQNFTGFFKKNVYIELAMTFIFYFIHWGQLFVDIWIAHWSWIWSIGHFFHLTENWQNDIYKSIISEHFEHDWVLWRRKIHEI